MRLFFYLAVLLDITTQTVAADTLSVHFENNEIPNMFMLDVSRILQVAELQSLTVMMMIVPKSLLQVERIFHNCSSIHPGKISVFMQIHQFNCC